MVTEETVKAIEADLEKWLSQIVMITCVANNRLSEKMQDEIRMLAIRLVKFMIVERKWKDTAIVVIREVGIVPDSCKSIDNMCHSMAHCLADRINDLLELSPEFQLGCENFLFIGDDKEVKSGQFQIGPGKPLENTLMYQIINVKPSNN